MIQLQLLPCSCIRQHGTTVATPLFLHKAACHGCSSYYPLFLLNAQRRPRNYCTLLVQDSVAHAWYITTLHSLCLHACCNIYSVLLAVKFTGVFILFTDCICMFLMILRTNRRDFSKQHQRVRYYNTETTCFPWGRYQICKCYILKFNHKGCIFKWFIPVVCDYNIKYQKIPDG